MPDTGAFEDNRYFDVVIEYAKHHPEDTFVRLTISNRGANAANLFVLPTLTFRNEWSWDIEETQRVDRPSMRKVNAKEVLATHKDLGEYRFQLIESEGPTLAKLKFTDNESNSSVSQETSTGERRFSKDAFDTFIVHGEQGAVRESSGTKCAFIVQQELAPQETITLRLRIYSHSIHQSNGSVSSAYFDRLFTDRIREADEFYSIRLVEDISLPE